MKKKKPFGRPSKLAKIDMEEFKQLALSGYTDKQLAKHFKINELTINRWKKQYPNLCKSLKDWKRNADAKVEKSLYKRALGYNYDEVVYEKSNVGGLGIKLSEGEIEHIKHCDTYRTKITVKQVVPDVTAQIFWLKNRQPERWRDKTEVVVKDSPLTQEEINDAASKLREAIRIAG